MKVAYLILAHNAPKHLQRLIKALSSSSSSIFIHLDKKSNFNEFLDIKNAHFTRKRIPIFWGDFSLVEATLILIRTAITDPSCFDRFVLLSGADYPLKSASYIEQFFANNPTKEFINLVPMPSEAAAKPISRLISYRPSSMDGTICKLKRRVLMRLGLFSFQRDYHAYLDDLVPYGGDAWWALSREACDFILAFVKNRNKAVNFFKNTLLPDESFFQTILGNSRFRSRIARNLTYADWSAREPHPAYITEKHIAFFQSTSSIAPDGVYDGGEMIFARKFPDESADLIARLVSRPVNS